MTPGSPDGLWGPTTAAAVGEFQEDHDLSATRELDAPTCRLLLAQDATGESRKATSVMCVQRYLSQLGHNPGSHDGVPKPETADAIAAAKGENIWLDDTNMETLAISLYVLTLPVSGGADPEAIGQSARFSASLEGIDLGRLPRSHLGFVRQLFIRQILQDHGSLALDLCCSEAFAYKSFSLEANITVEPDSTIQGWRVVFSE